MQKSLILVATVFATACASAPQQTPKSSAGWTISTPEAEGVRRAPLDTFTHRARSGALGNIDRIVVVRNGKLIWNETFAPNYDSISRGKKTPLGCGVATCTSPADSNHYNYLHPAWHPWYQGRRVHTEQTVTKSVAATLVGIALDRKEVTSLQAPLLSFFKEYDLGNVDPRLHKATLADLLTMRSGIEWHEQDRPLDETNTTLQLERSNDWIRFTLSQPMDAEPGTRWAYSSGGSQLMAQVIKSATGMHAHEYAARHLFAPLGIRNFHWKITPSGHPDTEGGLFLESEDLAKIGQLYLDNGVWNGKRILSEQWVKDAVAVHVVDVNRAGFDYGYQWWRLDRDGTVIWAGLGFGEQYLLVFPEFNTVAVLNSWNVYGPRGSALAPFIAAVIQAHR